MTVVSRPVNAHQSLTIGPALITFEPRFSLHPDNNPAVLRVGLVVPSMNSKTGSLNAVNASESKTQREREVESLGVSDPLPTSSDSCNCNSRVLFTSLANSASPRPMMGSRHYLIISFRQCERRDSMRGSCTCPRSSIAYNPSASYVLSSRLQPL